MTMVTALTTSRLSNLFSIAANFRYKEPLCYRERSRGAGRGIIKSDSTSHVRNAPQESPVDHPLEFRIAPTFVK